MRAYSSYVSRRSVPAPFPPARAGPGLRPGVKPRVIITRRDGGWNELFQWYGSDSAQAEKSALALLVARVVADDHDPAVAPDDPALVADPLDARLDLHGVP
jgi:hypothetical protein